MEAKTNRYLPSVETTALCVLLLFVSCLVFSLNHQNPLVKHLDSELQSLH